ncbi:hypothetical protein Tco_0478194 [Tanacetum coccineum]
MLVWTLWRDVNLLCQSLHSDDVEDFWRTQDEWVVSGWRLYPKSSVQCTGLNDWENCCICLCGQVLSDRGASLLEKDVTPQGSQFHLILGDVVVAGSVIQTIQDGLRESYECLASAPMFDNAPTRDIAKDSMRHINDMYHYHLKNGTPPNRWIIKSSSKLLSPKKEEESKEVKPLKLDSDDLHLNRNDGNPVDKESEASEIVIDEKELSDH